MEQVFISIYVPVFNHEKYVTQALDSILMQKTEYSYEVLVGEDCSTDNTRQVLKEWEAAHPDDRFTFFYRAENMHCLPCNNIQDLKNRCKGKYMICLEGDDFWTDPEKLQKQVSFLENHPEYYAVSHNCTVVGADSLPNGEVYPQCKDTEYTFRHYANFILPGQTATFLFRNYVIDPEFDQSLILKTAGPGDQNLYFSILSHGKIHCLQEAMSAYRHITTEGSSYSATFRYRYETLEYPTRCRLEYAYKLGIADAISCMEHLYVLNLRRGLLRRHIGLKRALSDFSNIRHKIRTLFLLVKRDVNAKLLNKPLSF